MCTIKPYVTKQLFVALCVYLGQLILCLSLVWPATNMFRDPEKTPLPQPITSTQWTLIELTFYVGFLIGACIFGSLSNYSGRKPCFFISGSLSFCALMLLATVKSIVVLYVGKFLIGLGSGMIQVAIIVYLGEIASTNIRGIILTSVYMFVFMERVIGIILNNLNIPYFILGYFGSAITAVFLCTLFCIPESPVYLTMKGSNEHLERSLISLGRENELPTMLSAKLEHMAQKKTVVDNCLDIVKVKSNSKAIFITLTLNILQRLSGSMAVSYFVPKFLDPNSVISFKLLIAAFNVSSIAGALCSSFFVDKVGRRTLLMVSTGSCGISVGILSSYFLIEIWFPDRSGYVWVYLIILINYFFSHSLGFSIPSTLIGEMFTPNVRSTGSATVIFMTTLLDFSMLLVSKLVLLQITVNVGLLFVSYCFTNLLAFLFTLFLVPETKGLTFVEINEMMSKKNSFRFN